MGSLRMCAVGGGGYVSSVCHTQRRVMLACPTLGDANLAYLVKVVTHTFFCCKGTFSSFVINNILKM